MSPEEEEKMKREVSTDTATTLESGARATAVEPVSGISPVDSSLGSSLSLYRTVYIILRNMYSVYNIYKMEIIYLNKGMGMSNSEKKKNEIVCLNEILVRKS